MDLEKRYYEKLATAFVIGKLKFEDAVYLTSLKESLEEMTPAQMNAIIQAGLEKGLSCINLKGLFSYLE